MRGQTIENPDFHLYSDAEVSHVYLHWWTLSTELILQERADVCHCGREQLSLAVLHRHIHETHGLGQSGVSGSRWTHFCPHANDWSAPASVLQHWSGRSYE